MSNRTTAMRRWSLVARSVSRQGSLIAGLTTVLMLGDGFSPLLVEKPYFDAGKLPSPRPPSHQVFIHNNV